MLSVVSLYLTFSKIHLVKIIFEFWVVYWKYIIYVPVPQHFIYNEGNNLTLWYIAFLYPWIGIFWSDIKIHVWHLLQVCRLCCIGARLMHVGDSSIYLNWLLENMYNKVPNSNSGKNYELF